MTKSDSRNVIVVLGMHRSGTSAVSGVLESLGFSIGKNIMPSSSNNPKGYFENKQIVDFNDHLLKQSGVNWADVYKLPFNFFGGNQFFAKQNESIKRLILDEFDLSGPLLIKDPRMSVLLPFWMPVFRELQLNPYYILVCRHPAGVSESLKVRDNLTELRSEKLWLYYNLSAELYTREYNRLFISYDHLLTEIPEAANRFFQYLPLPVPPGPEAEERMSRFVEPGLNHHNIDHAGGSFSFAETGKVFDLLEHACKTVNLKGLEAKMDEIRTGPELANIFLSSAHEEGRARITLVNDEGKSFDQYFKINYDTEQITLEYEHSVPINKLIFNPASCPCMITLNQIRILNKENQLIKAENLETNATYTAGDLFLFNFPFPIIRFTLNPLAGPVRLIIPLHYHMIGERTPSYFLETFFKQLIIDEKHQIKVFKETEKELLRSKIQLDEITRKLNNIQHSSGFRILRYMMLRWYLLKRFLAKFIKIPDKH
jgi:hypothetical protein